MAKVAKKSGAVTVDFEGVESFVKARPGTYEVEVEDCSYDAGRKGSNGQFKFVFKITKGKFKGAKIWDYVTHVKQSMWRLRAILVALGQDVPDEETQVVPADLIGLSCGVVTEFKKDQDDEPTEYLKVTSFIGEGDVDDEAANDDATEEDDEEETKSSKKKSKAEDEDEEETSVGDPSKMDEDELKELVEEQGLDVEIDDFSSIKKKRAAVIEALDGGSSDDEEEEDDKETYSTDTLDEMGLSDLEGLNDEHNLKIKNFDDLSKSEARKAVAKALKKAGLLKD